MASFNRLLRDVANRTEDTPPLTFWSRIWSVDSATDKKHLTYRRKYTVVSVNEETQTVRMRVNDTDKIVVLTAAQFGKLYAGNKAPSLPDEE